MDTIRDGLGSVNPIAIGMTPKRFANIRSDFVAAVNASGVIPVKNERKAALSPDWLELFTRLSGRRAHFGLSRLGRYASAKGIQPGEINDDIIEGLMTAVRERSLHQNPKALHRQVTLIWNEAAQNPELGRGAHSPEHHRLCAGRQGQGPAARRHQGVNCYRRLSRRTRFLCAGSLLFCRRNRLV
jgi:hypothetical protein